MERLESVALYLDLETGWFYQMKKVKNSWVVDLNFQDIHVSDIHATNKQFDANKFIEQMSKKDLAIFALALLRYALGHYN
jgi:hypothetical protein